MSAAFQSNHTVPPHVPAQLIFYFDTYRDERVTDDVRCSYATVLKDGPDIFCTPANCPWSDKCPCAFE
jgi:hypothetical protein